MSRTNNARHTEWHETCKCKCRLDASVCNNCNVAKNWLIKEYVIKDLFGILVIVIVNVINDVMLEDI